MTVALRLGKDLTSRLVCPACRHSLSSRHACLSCAGCGLEYPIVNGVPVLLHDTHGVIDPGEIASGAGVSVFKDAWWRRLAWKFVPDTSANLVADEILNQMAEDLADRSGTARVLVVGGGEGGRGMRRLVRPGIQLVHSEIFLGPRVDAVVDGHAIPFADETFDGVVVEAVLEHVLEPHRVVDEIYRVLRPGGVVFAETPFMQQVHGGAHDFTRLTALGHRRLFRHFEEIRADIVAGPGTALAWAWEYFLMSFARRRVSRMLLRVLARLLSYPLHLFDRTLARRPGGWDAASCFAFYGRKGPAGWALSDSELLAGFRGWARD